MNQLSSQFSAKPSVPAHMRSASRYSLYRHIHKALRALMGETLVRIGQLNSYDSIQLQGALAQVRTLAGFCELRMAQCNDAHPNRARHLAACRQLVLIAATTQNAGASLRPALVDQMYQAIVRLVQDCLVYMTEEEGGKSTFLWFGYDEEELMEIEHAIAVLLAARDTRASLRWTLPVMTHDARLSLLAGARMCMPAEVFDDMLDSVKYFVPCGEWNKLMARLYGGQRLAA